MKLSSIPLIALATAASPRIIDGFVVPGSKSISIRSPPTALHAQIYMPDGSIVQDDEEDWMEAEKSQTSNALLRYLNGPNMRGPLAVLAAAHENIDISSIEHVNVQAVTPSAIHIEAICSREDMHCVNVLAKIDFPDPEYIAGTDEEILALLNAMYRQANAKLERKNIKTGTVVSFNPGKGFGFISMDDRSGDVYVHHSNILRGGYRKLGKGERVEFKTGVDTKRGTGKPFAYDVMQIGSGSEESDEGTTEEEESTSAADAKAVQAEPVDISIPYDAAAQLAYEASDKSTVYEAFKARYKADAIAMVTAKKNARAGASLLPAKKAETKVESEEREENAKEESKLLENALAKEPKNDYASMDLEERAFNILLDLGLISLTPDPDSPDYDSSKDDEFAPENINV